MPMIPAFCDRCGKATQSQVLIRDNTYHIQDHVVGTCECGGEMRLLDGTYSHLGGPLNFCHCSDEDHARFCAAAEELGVAVYQP